MLSRWPTQGGHYPVAAHLSVWGALIAMQIASAIWYVLPSSVLEKRGGVAS
jgi:hypothetical protein